MRDPRVAGALEGLAGNELARLLNRVEAFVTRYVAVGAFEAIAITLWIVHTWVLDAFDATG
jgi:hypothetical protein